MGYRSILISGALCCSGWLPSMTATAQQVPSGYVRVAEAHGIPPEALYSVSLTESSRKLPMGVRPWPWTLNVAGKGYRYESRLQAWQALQVFMKNHPLKRIDVGIAQVNLGWNGHYFNSTWEAFDPYVNLNAAASILHDCWMRQPGSWLDAAGCYHHPAGGKHAAQYTAIVKRHLAQLTITDKPTSEEDLTPSVTTPTSDQQLVWIEPRSSS